MSEKIGEIEELGEDLNGVLEAYHKTEATLRRYLTTSLVCVKREREKNARHIAGAEQTQRVLRAAHEENAKLQVKLAKLREQLDRLSRFPGSQPGFVVGARVRHKATSLVGTLRSGSSVNNVPTWRVECRVPSYDHGRRPDDAVVYGEWTESELVLVADDDDVQTTNPFRL